jgi:hypothetical protein
MKASEYGCVTGAKCVCQFCTCFKECGCNVCEGYARIDCQFYLDGRKIEIEETE